MPRCYIRSVVTTDRMRETKRLPASESVPKHILLQITDLRRHRSARLFLVGIPSTPMNVHLRSSVFRSWAHSRWGFADGARLTA